jgi:DNA polymerase-3 subunit epsilon
MAQLFDDEILSVVLRFTNQGKAEMQDADKLASRLSMSLDGVVRRAVAAGKSVGDIVEAIQRIEPSIRALEKRTAGIGSSAGVLMTAQQVLNRYTPYRLERMAETAATRIAETSGTAALRRELEKHGALIQRQMATRQGMYDPVTKGKVMGQALFIDTETTGLKALKHQVVELTATLFSFNKETGEFGKVLKSYTGMQQLSYQGRHQFLSPGLSAELLKGQAISTTMIRHLVNKADFLIAHNAPFDKKFVQQLVPYVASKIWMDSLRGIPWRMHGFESRSLQDLIRFHGIDAGQAHRTQGDVGGSLRLLASRSPLGGQPYMAQLLANQGPLTRQQQILATVKQQADEILENLQSRIGGGATRYMSPVARYRRRAAAYDDEGHEVYAQHVIATIEGGIEARSRRPSRSTDYGIKKGSGVAPETTPGLIGAAAIGLDRRIGVIESFYRNMAIMSGPASSAAFLTQYERQARHQEGIQQGRGRGRQVKEDIRHGDELALALMQGINTHYRQVQEPGFGIAREMAQFEAADRGKKEDLRAEFASMLSSPWAQRAAPPYSQKAIASFISRYREKPAMLAIRPAAQMANQVGFEDPRFRGLTSIMTEGQVIGRRLAAAKIAQAQRDFFSGATGASFQPRAHRNLIGEALRGMGDLGGGRGGSEAGFGNLDFMSFGLYPLYRKIKEMRDRTKAGRHPLEPPESAESRVNRGAPFGPPSADDPRAQMRYDALQSRLKNLADAVDAAARKLNEFRDVTAKAKMEEAARRRGSRESALGLGLAGTEASFDAQVSRLQARRAAITRIARGRLEGIQGTYEERTTNLAFAELDAEKRYSDAVKAQGRLGRKLRASKKRLGLTDADIQERLESSIRDPQLRMIRARYRSEASRLSPGDWGLEPGQEGPFPKFDKLETLRRQTSTAAARAMYGGSAELEEARQQYEKRYYTMLGGRTLEERAKSKISDVGEGRVAAEEQIDNQIGLIEKRRAAAREKADQARIDNERKFAGTSTKIQMDINKKEEDQSKKRQTAYRKEYEAKVRYVKSEDARGGGPGGGGPGGGAGGGGGGGRAFGSREGYLGFGVGASMLASAGSAVFAGVKQMATYAAQVDTLVFSTKEIAKINALDVDAVMGSVQNVKKLNMTTESANQLVQKMIFAQLDVGKAGQLAKVAQNVSVITGQTPSEAAERLITGISTGLTMTLHRMGLPVSMLQVNRQLNIERKAEGKTGPASEVEKRQALLNAVILEGAKANGLYEKSLMTAGGQLKLFEQNVVELQYSVGKAFLPEFTKFVGMLSKGVKYADDNSAAMARYAKVLTAISAALGALGTFSFMRFLAATPVIPLPLKVASAAVGLAAYGMMNEDAAKDIADNSKERVDFYKKKTAADFDKLSKSSGDGSPEAMASRNQLLEQIKADISTRMVLEEDLTGRLGEEYNARVKALDKYIADIKGKNGVLSALLAGFEGNPELGMFGTLFSSFSRKKSEGQRKKESQEELAKKFSAYTGGTVKPGAIVRESDLQKAASEAEAKGDVLIINTERAQIQAFISEMLEAEGKLNKLDEKYSELGNVGLRARKSMGSPREKIMLDYEQEIANIDVLGKKIKEVQAGAKANDPVAKRQLDLMVTGLGGGELGRKRLENFDQLRKNVTDKAVENRDIQLGKLNRMTQAQIGQTRDQLAIEKIQSNVTIGNYASEKQAILDVYIVKENTAKKTLKLLNNVDDYNKQVVANEVERDSAIIRLDTERKRATQAMLEKSQLRDASIAAQDLLDKPGATGSVVDAMTAAAQIRMDSTSGIQDENKRLEEQVAIFDELTTGIKRYNKELLGSDAEQRIAMFKDSQDLAMQIDRTISAKANKRQSPAYRALDEIQRTRKAQVAEIEEAYEERKKYTTIEGQGPLKNQRDLAMAQANSRAAIDSIKVVEQEIDTARERLAKSIGEVTQSRVEYLQGIAVGQNEEMAAAENIHTLRLKNIQAEFEARDQTLEAEQTKEEQIREAEMEKLKQMLDLRKQHLEEIRSLSEGIFQAFSQYNRGPAIKSFMTDQFRSFGSKVFGNFMVDTLKDVKMFLPGLENVTYDKQGNPVHTPTWLGKMLSGTMLGTKVPTKEEIDAQLNVVTVKNTTATDKNTDALNRLTARLLEMEKNLGITPGLSSGGTMGALGGGRVGWVGPPNLGPEWGGTPSITPYQFGFMNPQLPGYQPGDRGVATSTAISFDDQAYQDRSETLFPGQDASILSGNAGALAGTPLIGGGGGGLAFASAYQGEDLPPLAPVSPGIDTGEEELPPLAPVSPRPAVTQANTIGTAVSVAAAGIAAYQAVKDFRRGGAGGALEGTGALLGAAAIIDPEPISKAILAGVAMGTSLVGSMINNPARRAQDISNMLQARQYLAPQALNVTASSAGTFADIGVKGQLRTSNFSPYPLVTQGFVWKQTHGLLGGPPTYYDVPGGQTSQFGSIVNPGARTPTPQPPVTVNNNYTVHTLDANSFHDYLQKNNRSVGLATAKSLQDGHSLLTREVQRAAR